MPKATSRKVIAFYGFKGGAGRSLLLVNLARAMAQQGKRVLIIDCDLEAPGLGDYLTGQSEPYPRWQEKDGIVNLIANNLVRPLDVKNEQDTGAYSAREETSSESFINIESGGGETGLRPGEGISDRNAHYGEANLESDNFARMLFGEGAPLNPSNRDTWLIKAKNEDSSRSLETGNDEAKTLKERREGVIYLLGPGTHRAEVPYPQQYAGQVVDLDWHHLVTSKEGMVLKLFGEALQSQEQKHFDYVLIDARTGYNFAAIALVQNWATDLVAVGTPSLQSIDGLARMMPIFSDIGIRCHLAISKALPEPQQGISPRASSLAVDPRDAEHTNEMAAKKRLIEDFYHRDMKERIYWFDFLEDLKFGDSDFWSRYPPDVMSTPYSNKGVRDLAPTEESRRKEEERGRVEAYARTVYELYAGVTSELLVSSAEEIGFTFRAKNLNAKTFNENSASSLERHKRAMDDPDIEPGKRLSAFIERVKAYCVVKSRDKSETPTSLSEPGGAVSSLERIATPLVNDAEFRGEGLAARDLARNELAKTLQDWTSKPEEYDETRIADVRNANGLSLLPVLVKAETRRTTSRGEKQGASKLDRLVWTAYGGVVQNPSDKRNPERLRQAREALNQTDRPDEKLRQAVELAECVVQGCARADAGETVQPNEWLSRLWELGCKLMPMIDSTRGAIEFHRPTESDELIQWNPYDAFIPYAAAASEALYEVKSDAVLELVKQLGEAQASVIAGLSRIDLRSQIKDVRQNPPISFFTTYLSSALQARRAFKTYDERSAPHPVTGVLNADEAVTLSECFDMDAYKAALESATGDDALEFQRAFGTRLSVNILSLSGRAKEAIDMLRNLRLRLMRQDHPSNLTTPPGVGDALERYQRYQEWAYLIFELGNVAGALKGHAEASCLYRLALRTYMPIRRSKDSEDNFLTACSASLAVSLARVGPPIDDRTIEELKNSDSQSYGWWPAARLYIEGHFVEALNLLRSNDRFNDDLAVVMWKCRCQAALGNVVELQQLEEHWRNLRSKNIGLFSDQLGDWLTLLHLHAGASLAVGETQRAIELLHTALEHIKEDELPGTERLRIALDVRLKLATLRRLSAGQDAALQTKALMLADEASPEVVQFLKELREEMGIDCDRAFDRYLREAANDFSEKFMRLAEPAHEDVGYAGGGVFAGIEAPSPLRRNLAEVLTEFAEILFYAKREADLLWLIKNMESVLPDFQALARFAGSQSTSFCYPTAAILALRSTTLEQHDEKTECQAEARGYMRRDIQINQGLGREQFYDRIFRVCGFS